MPVSDNQTTSQHFSLVATDIDVSQAIAELDAHPELWNGHPERRAGNSPHRETSDIWLRYRDPAELRWPVDFQGPHESMWYWPVTKLRSSVDIVFDIARKVGATRIGGVLITRIPAGCKVYPHDDRGTWHAEYYTTKVYVPLRANSACINYCGGEATVIRVGEAVKFDNLVTHSVENNGLSERATLIACFRTE